MSVQIFYPFFFFYTCVVSFIIEFRELFIYSRYKLFVTYMVRNCFLQVCSLAYHSFNSHFLKSRSFLKFWGNSIYPFEVTSNPRSQRFSLTHFFFLEMLQFLGFAFRPMVHLGLNLGYDVSSFLCMFQVRLLALGYPTVPAPFVEMTELPLHPCKKKKKICYPCMCRSAFWTLSSATSIYLSILTPLIYTASSWRF